MSSSSNPGKNQLMSARLKLIGLTLASAGALAGAFYYSWTGPKKDLKEKILELIKRRISKPKVKVAVTVDQPMNNIASLSKPGPTIFPGRAENLADEIKLLQNLDNKNQSLTTLNEKLEETASTTLVQKDTPTVVQKDTPPTDPEAVLITFAVYFTILAFVFNIISIPFR